MFKMLYNLGIQSNTTLKIKEIAFQGFQISKFSRGSMPPDPPRFFAPSPRDYPPPQLQCPGAATTIIKRFRLEVNVDP